MNDVINRSNSDKQ